MSTQAIVERDGLLDALEKAERQREDLRTTANNLVEYLMAAGRALGEIDGKRYRDAAAEGSDRVARVIGEYQRALAYHPDPAIAAEIARDAIDGDLADLMAGFPPSAWRCPCGAEHSRGPLTNGRQHRCLRCGYIGEGSVLLAGSDDDRG